MIQLNPIYTITILLLLTTAIKTQPSKLLQHTKSLNYIYLLQTKYPTRKVIEISIQILQRTQQLHQTIKQHTSFIDKIYNLSNKYHLYYYHSDNNTFLPLRQVYQTQNESQRVYQPINNTIQVQFIDNYKYQFYHSLTLHLRQPQSFLPFMTELSILQQQHHFEMTLAYQDEIIDKSAINDTYMKDYITKQSEKRCQKYFKMSLNHIISYQNIQSYLLKKQQLQTANPQKSNSHKNKDPTKQNNQKSQYKTQQQQWNKTNSNNNQSQIQIKVNNIQIQKQFLTYSYYDALQQIQQQKINQLVQRQKNHIFRVQIVCNNEKYKSIKRDQQIKRVINNITSSNNSQGQTASQTNRQNKKVVDENIVIKDGKRNNVKEIVAKRSQLIVIKQQKKSKQKIQKANKIDVNAINDKLKAMKSQSEAQQKIELKQKKGEEKQMKRQLKQKKGQQKQKTEEKVEQYKQKKGQQKQKTKTSNKRPKIDKKRQTNEL